MRHTNATGTNAMLNWHKIEQPNRNQKWVKGTELEYCFPDGFLHRFKIVSVRAYPEGYDKPDVFYRVYDAETVTDSEVLAGIYARSTRFLHPTLESALAAIEPYRHFLNGMPSLHK